MNVEMKMRMVIRKKWKWKLKWVWKLGIVKMEIGIKFGQSANGN